MKAMESKATEAILEVEKLEKILNELMIHYNEYCDCYCLKGGKNKEGWCDMVHVNEQIMECERFKHEEKLIDRLRPFLELVEQLEFYSQDSTTTLYEV